MADTTPTITQAEPEHPIEQRIQQRFLVWHRLALVGITLISIFMDFFQLGANGYGSYYPPAVRSMMDNWHNFFFASYDPGGFVTIDKPPVGFWFQVLSAKIFGFNAVSILVPQALAGVLSVLLLYYLVRRHFGVVAGLLAALALAISPISVVTNRNNTIDSTLVLVMLLGHGLCCGRRRRASCAGCCSAPSLPVSASISRCWRPISSCLPMACCTCWPHPGEYGYASCTWP